MSKHVFALLLLLGATSGAAREPAKEWFEVRTPRFVVVANTSVKQARRIAVQFERMRAVFQQAYPQLEDESSTPVFVLVIKSKDQFRELEPRAYASDKSLPLHGMFVHASDKNYVLMRVDSAAGSPFAAVYHEYTHLFLREADERFPLWLNEGLAQFYENTEIYDQDALLGEPNLKLLMLLRQEQLLPLPALFTVDEKSPYYLEHKKGALFYAECWALTHYLTLKDYGEKTSKVAEYITLVNRDVDPVSAAVAVFGDLRKLQRNLEIYIEQRSFDHFEARIPRKIDDSIFDVHSITTAEVDALKADYLAASGRLEESRARFPHAEPGSAWEKLSAIDKKLSPKAEEDIPCPLAEILKGASDRATEMVDNLQRFTATEQIEHTEFRKSGKPRHSLNQLFSYVAEIDQNPSGAFWVEEYREAKTEADSPPLSDTGTAAFALIFHPLKIGNFEFHCESHKDIRGIPAWQLRFEEGPDPRNSFHQIRVHNSNYQLRFKGRAWIAEQNYEILRLQTDLMAPMPEIRLQTEHLDITYAPVDFDKSKFRVWLPETASIEMRYGGRSYQRIHRFDHFQLFLVVTEQRPKEPSPGPGE